MRLTRREMLLGAAVSALAGRGSAMEPEGNPIDLARAASREAWLHHPIVGDPSWDAFEREPGNPLHTGRDPRPWPVNGFLFRDPPSGRWYAYVSVYPRGYFARPPADCLLYRERAGGGWEEVGLLFEKASPPFVMEGTERGAMTDASVVFDGVRYHLLYGWANPANSRGGLAYAWADRPEGPFHCAPAPLHDDAKQTPVLGRYVRAYASTLFRRKRDWLVLHMMSTPGNAGGTWALFCIAAERPEGPYGAPVPLLLPQSDVFHPPLAEFYPAFAHAGRLYAPATSVAMNRTFQTLFSAPVERAHRPSAWRIEQYGSVWHSEPVPHEAQGIWGQTFSGQVAPDGTLRVLFPSKTREDVGTTNMARRPWNRPFRNGFALSAPRAPALAVLRRAYGDFDVTVEASASGPWALGWGCGGPLGSNHHLADSVPHARMRADRVEWRRVGSRWSLAALDASGRVQTLAEGERPARPNERVEVARRGARVTLRLNGADLWTGDMPAVAGRLELVAESGTVLRVGRFAVTGAARPGLESWLSTEALTGAAAVPEEWKAAEDARFRYGVGHLSARPDSRAKWNWTGRGFRLWSPRGPEYGRCRVLVDGAPCADLDLRAPAAQYSAVVLERSLPPGRHALVLTPLEGAVPLDTLEVAP